MRKSLTLLSALGIAGVMTLGACSGPDALVGVNAGAGGGSGAAVDDVPTAGSSQTTGAGASSGAPAITPGGGTIDFYVTEITPRPDASICAFRPLSLDATGRAPCEMYPITTVTANGQACTCESAGLSGPVEGPVRDSIIASLHDYGVCVNPEDGSSATPCEDECICQLAQAQGADLTACQSGAAPGDENGWCYVSPSEGAGDPSVVAECPAAAKRAIVLYGDDIDRTNGLLILACGLMSSPIDMPKAAAPVGAPCLLGDEYRQSFNGYNIGEVDIENHSNVCNSGMCISNHFQGRASCPYGQTQDQLNDPQCFLPSSNIPVTVPVAPQLVARPADETVFCSCRCAGPDNGPFCACPDDMECSPLVADLGLPGNEDLIGSYCIPKGTAYDPTAAILPDTCDLSRMNCGDPRPY